MGWNSSVIKQDGWRWKLAGVYAIYATSRNIWDTCTRTLRRCGKSIKFITVEPVIALEAGKSRRAGCCCICPANQNGISANKTEISSIQQVAFFFFSNGKNKQTKQNKRQQKQSGEEKKTTETPPVKPTSSWQRWRQQQTSSLNIAGKQQQTTTRLCVIWLLFYCALPRTLGTLGTVPIIPRKVKSRWQSRRDFVMRDSLSQGTSSHRTDEQRWKG